MVQLHGRWSSLAVQKYLQDAPLLMVPGVVARALSSGEAAAHGTAEHGVLVADAPRSQEATSAQDGADAQGAAESCLPARRDAEIEALRLQFSARTQEASRSLVVNTRTRRAHRPDESESATRPELWSTACGISYGNTRFFRQKCRRCFQGLGCSDDEGGSSSGNDSSSVLTSSSSRLHESVFGRQWSVCRGKIVL